MTSQTPEIQSLFTPYTVARITGGQPHPAELVQTKAMEGIVTPPLRSGLLRIPIEIAKTGKLSDVQLERVAYAQMAHETKLPSGAAYGSIVDDGTGVGKGRINAGIAANNWFQGIRRILWVSVSDDLRIAAQDDFNDLGINIPLHAVNKWKADQTIDLKEGVLFSTYSSLISRTRKGGRRLDMLLEWLDGDGGKALIIFDECHKAKNFVGSAMDGKMVEGTQTGKAVVELQDVKKYPAFRVVYSSATAFSEVRNMAYLVRMGLWGAGTQFEGFKDYCLAVSATGVAGMELICRDLRANGLFSSANLSYNGVEYQETTHELSLAQHGMYDKAAQIWRVVSKEVEEAIKLTNLKGQAKGRLMAQFWAAHQRFFSGMLLAMKMPTVLREIEQGVTDGFAVILTLLTTSEARTQNRVADAAANDSSLDDLDFTPRDILATYISKAFPTIQHEEYEDENGSKSSRPVIRNGQPVESRAAVELRDQCLELLGDLHFPQNPLDQMIEYFGADRVAEITGRKKRLVRNGDGHVEYKSRAPEGIAMKDVNKYEMQRFMAGDKFIAVISAAGSTGISLHASRRAGNRRRRMHIIAQFSWSADSTLQNMGRSHRSDSESNPIYNLIATNAGGEMRFRSSVAKRIRSLGALTRGDRASADGSGLMACNYESDEGRQALFTMLTNILNGRGMGIERVSLRNMGLLKLTDAGETVRDEDISNVPRFLNRLLALSIEEQNKVFDLYSNVFEQTVAKAKEAGIYDLGVEYAKGQNFRFGAEPLPIAQHAQTGATTVFYHVIGDVENKRYELDRLKERAKHGAFALNKRSEKVSYAIGFARTDFLSGSTEQCVRVIRPSSSEEVMPAQEFNEHFSLLGVKEGEARWQQEYDAMPLFVEKNYYIIAGLVLPLWAYLKGKDDDHLTIVKVEVNGQSILGVQLRRNKVEAIVGTIQRANTAQAISPYEMFYDLLDGKSFECAGGFKVKKTRFRGQDVIELSNDNGQLCKGFGFLPQIVDHRFRYFAPMDESEAVGMLDRLLSAHGVIIEGKAKEFPPIHLETTLQTISLEELFRVAEQKPLFLSAKSKKAAAAAYGQSFLF